MEKDDLKEIRINNLKEWFKNRTLPLKDKSLISQLMSGRASFGEKVSRRLEAEYGMGEGYLDSVNRPIESNATPIGMIRFDHLNITASMGEGAENSEFVEVVNYVAVAEKWAREHLGSNLKDIRVITAKGDSMSPTIEANSVLFVDSSISFFDGEGIYIVHTSDGLKAKRLQLLINGGINIISDNSRYPIETVSKENLDSVQICGKVRGSWALSEFK